MISLNVAWTLDAPPLRPRTAHAWPTRNAEAASTLEARLGWPGGTLSTLNAAFSARLGRAVGWEDAADAPLPSPVEAAARVFKRGVGYRRASTGDFATKKAAAAYTIEIDDGDRGIMPLLRDAGSFLVVDANVAHLWKHRFKESAPVTLACDEHRKTLESVALLLEAAAVRGAPKQWVLCGGGILTDIASFAASLVDASIVMVPTTLLAMADASVGGKTGVNFPPFGKNQVGTFHFPDRVVVSTSWLSTLPDRELLAGGAECLKHAFLAGDMNLARRLSDALRRKDIAALVVDLAAVIKVKADVVAEDPGESGRRASLNFGHTLAHALEALSHSATSGDTTLLHGEAVALGMAFALLLSAKVSSLATDDLDRMLNALRDARLLLPRRRLAAALGAPDLAAPEVFAQIAALLAHDKKNVAQHQNHSEWILLAAPGQIARPRPDAWTQSVGIDDLRGTWSDFVALLS